MVLSGALTGIAAPYPIRAFGVLPIFPGLGTKGLHEVFEEIHEIVFEAFIMVLAVHVVFHIWRHYWIKDNALRIMAPKALHRYL